MDTKIDFCLSSEGMNTPLPKLYIKNGCPWCHEAMEWLDRHQIQYLPIDVRSDQAAFKTLEKISGQSKTPTLQMPDGRLLADFGAEELPAFLHL